MQTGQTQTVNVTGKDGLTHRLLRRSISSATDDGFGRRTTDPLRRTKVYQHGRVLTCLLNNIDGFDIAVDNFEAVDVLNDRNE